MVPAAKEILFSTGILFIHLKKILSGVFPKAVFFPWDFQIWSNSKTFPGTGKWICYFPCYLAHLGTPIICKTAWLFYRLSISLIFVCTSSKLSKASSSFNPNITTTSVYARPPYVSGSNSKRGIIGACALSARTYNAEVPCSDVRIRNHFIKSINVSQKKTLWDLLGSAER